MLYLSSLIALLLSINTLAQSPLSPFELNGYAKGAKDSSIIYLEPIIEKNSYYKFEADSCLILKGKFTLKGKLRGPLGVRFVYYFNEEFSRSGMVFIEKGKLNTQFSIDTLQNNIVSILGSATQQQYQRSFFHIFNKYKNLNDAWTKQIQKKYDEFEGDKLDSAISEMKILSREITDKYITEISKYAVEHNNSIIPIFLMIDQSNGYEEKLATTLPYFSSKIKQGRPYQLLNETFNKSKSLQIDEYFPKLDLVNLHSNRLQNLSTSYSKKHTFIDFWFAKCGACIRQFPAYRRIVNSYNGTKLFNLISITIDTEKEINNALNIIDSKKANWAHFWDKDGKNSFSLNINSYPTNFLIDSTGKIIAKNIEPLELDRFLRTDNK